MTDDGRSYYVDHNTKMTTWQAPMSLSEPLLTAEEGQGEESA